MKKLLVHYCGWGEDWLLGELTDDGDELLFSYSAEALKQGLELSPLRLKLQSAPFGAFPLWQHQLPGLIADSLPDGWGLLLMDRLFRQQGLRHPRPLDRLAFIGDRGMGALRFVPASTADEVIPDWSLLALAEESQRTLAGEATTALRALALTGGSPQGARPKALVQFDTDKGKISTRPDAPGTPWLVKFPAQGEHKEVCAIEQLYATLARACGLDMPDSCHVDLSSKLAAFGIARFDREQNMRVPVHSFASLLHVDFRLPGAADYTGFLRATRLLTRSETEVTKAYERAVFNVLFHNRDDHPKNFAWRLNQARRWKLAPAFDLTFSDGPMGQHHMDICGEARQPGRQQLLQLATEGGVAQDTAIHIIDRLRNIAADFAQYAQGFPIRKNTVRQIQSLIEASSSLLGPHG